MNPSGWEKMIKETGECRDIFVAADRRLYEVIAPLPIAAGHTDEVLAGELENLRAEAERAG